MAQTPLAILGYGCRLPGGIADGSAYWRALADGRDLITEVPADRWSPWAFYSPRGPVPGKSATRWGGFLDRVDGFEPECFGISPREAPHVDPQHRLLLETTWEALEMAGVPAGSLAGSRTGVFVGISTNDYSSLQKLSHARQWYGPFTGQGSSHCIAANRLSYCLDLRGPSFAIDTACSSALVAVDRAARSLSAGECDLALAGGVNSLLVPDMFVVFSAATMLSPDGRCKAFDAAANGYVRAEGGGMVVLKRLADAVRDGDPIQAVVLATGTNQDGRTNGITMPNPDAQEALLRDVYAGAGIPPGDVSYVEAHGTGTPVGDPAEAFALGRVLGAARPAAAPLPIGSVKTNLGHLEAGSGAASLVKAVLMLQRRQVPPSLHFRTPNPHIPFGDLRLRVPTELEPWPDDRPGIIGINSFGFGGANAHAVLGEYRPARPAVGGNGRPAKDRYAQPPAGRDDVLVLTARGDEVLRGLARTWLDRLADPIPGPSWADWTYTAACRREHYEHRLALPAASAAEAADGLRAFLAGEPRAGVCTARRATEPPGVAFVFCGQGAQWHAMGRELLAAEPVFRGAMTEIDALLRAEVGWSLLDVLSRDEADSPIERTSYGQPALFAIQVALARLWQSWGVEPAVALGHSVGEVAAAHVAGLLSLEAAVRVIAHRGRCLEEYARPGRMAAVALSEGAARELLEPFGGDLHMAAVNSPDMVTVAGEADALDRLGGQLDRRGTWWRALRVRHAFHTPLVDPARGPFLDAIGPVDGGAPRRPMVSTVTGEAVSDGALSAEYWWRNIRSPVRFADAVGAARRLGVTAFLEIGPHPVLAANIKQCHGAARHWSVPSLRRGEPERRTLLAGLAQLFVLGVPVRWRALWPDDGRAVEQPPHPWSREVYWHEPPEARQVLGAADYHPLLGHRQAGARPPWQSAMALAEFPWLRDHRVGGRVVVPAAAFVEVALAAATRSLGSHACVIDTLVIRRPMVLSEEVVPQTEATVEPELRQLSYASRAGAADNTWLKHFEASFRPAPAGDPRPAPLDLDAWAGAERVPGDVLYDAFRRVELHYGPAFRGVREVCRRPWAALGRVELPADAQDPSRPFAVHPALLDACFQVILEAIPLQDRLSGRMYLPERIGRIHLRRAAGDRVWSEVRITDVNDVYLVADIAVYAEDGEPVLSLEDFRCRGSAPPADARRDIEGCFHRAVWQYSPLPGDPGPATFPWPGDPAEVMAQAEAESRAVRHDQSPGGASRADSWIERAAAVYLRDALASLGAPGPVVDVDALVRAGAVRDRHRPWLERCLAAAGGLGRDPSDDRDLGRLWRGAMARSTEAYPALRLLELAAGRLADVWAGRAEPSDLLAGEEAADLHEQWRHGRAWGRFANAVLQRALVGVVAGVPTSQPLRVLELAAGDGGTTRALLPVLPDNRTQYWLTDPSQARLDRAAVAFRRADFVRYHKLDPDRDFTGQGVPPGAFDVVVANDPRAVPERCARALVPGGVLMVREDAFPGLWGEIVGGMVGGSGESVVPGATHDLLVESGFGRPAMPALCRGPGVGAVVYLARVPAGVAAVNSSRVTREIEAERGGHSRPHAPREERGPSPGEIVRAPAGGRPLPHAEREDDYGPAATDLEPAWLVLADRGGAGEDLARRLRAAGARAVLGFAGTHFAESGPDAFEVDPASPADLARLRKACGLPEGGRYGVAYCWGLDVSDAAPATPDGLTAAAARACHGLIHLLQAFAGASGNPPARLVVTTRQAREFGARVSPGGALQASLLGLMRVAATEYGGVRFAAVDVGGDDPAGAVLWREVAAGSEADEVAWRDGNRFVPRLRAWDPRETPRAPADAPFEVALGRPGDLDGLHLREITPRPPGPGEVQVAVRIAGLNFLDLLRALGNLPAEGLRRLDLGDECAGVVAAVGEGVEGLAVGDRVLAFDVACFRTAVNVPARNVVPLPPEFDLVGGATMPVVYGTVLLALRETAGLRAGEAVLVHSAAGGVGLAAVNYARSAGARLFATVGSPAKRALLEKYGPERVMDSRSLGFSDELLAATGGRGADVVLNSLAGQAMVRTLACLAPEGRFVEIGKRDFFEQTKVSLWPLRRNASFHAVDLGYRMSVRPESVVRNIVEALSATRTDPEYLPPLPARVFPAARAADALRLLSQGTHVGKIVLDLAQPWGQVRARPPEVRVRPGRSYLVTGAFGGVGLNLARWLAERGAEYLVLLSRSGPPDPGVLDRLRETGVKAVEWRCDVADERALRAVLHEVRQVMPPLAGVFHPAMVLDDATIANLDGDRFDRVFGPKVHGAWNLHRLTAGDSLDSFVLFSSVSAWIGSYGQANYAAANAALEALAWHRRQEGRPASAVALGVLGEVGYVAAREDLAQSLAQLGLTPIGAADVRRALEVMLAAEDPVAVVARADWSRLAQKVHGPRRRGLLADLAGEAAATTPGPGGAGARAAVLGADPADRPQVLTDRIRSLAAKVLGMPAGKLDVDRPLAALGLDSLMGVELVSLLESNLGVAVPLTSLSRDVTITKLVEVLLPTMTGSAPARPGPGAAAPPAGPSLVRLAGTAGAPAVYFVHPAGGDLLIYRELAEALAPGACVQGVQSRMLDGRSPEFATLAEAGAAYARLVVGHDPRGPYRLFGFSFGGLLALEAAHALERLGKPVAWVAVAEADHLRARPAGDPTDRLAGFFVEIVGHLQDGLTVFDGLPLDRLRDEAPRLMRATMAESDGRGAPLADWLLRYLRPGASAEVVTDYIRRVAAHIRLVADPDRRAPAAARVVSWRARRGLAADLPLPPPTDHEETRWLEAGHFATMAPPHSGDLAAQLQELLDGRPVAVT